MKKTIKKKSVLYVILGLMAFSLVACGKKDDVKKDDNLSEIENSSHYPVVIETYNYKKEPVEMTFNKAPEKVVAIYQNSIETLLALGLEDKIVLASGLDHNVKDEFEIPFETVRYLDTIPSKEEVIASEPDFILSWYSIFDDKKLGDIDFWNERKVNTYMAQNSGITKNDSLENEYQDILNMGKIFNVETKANLIVDEMKNRIETTLKKVEGNKKVNTVILEIEKENSYRNYGKDSIGGSIATSVGADLVNPKNGSFGAEDLVKLNPEVIFTVYYGDQIERDASLDMIMNNKALANVKAVKNKRVYPIMLSEVYASGIRTYDGINSIINGLYPDLD